MSLKQKPVMKRLLPPLRKSLSLNPKAISRMMTATLLSLLRLVASRIRMQMKNRKRNRRKTETKDTEKKIVKPKVTVKSHKGGNVILGVSCVVLAASVVVMGMTIAESRKSDSVVYPSTGSTLNISVRLRRPMIILKIRKP